MYIILYPTGQSPSRAQDPAEKPDSNKPRPTTWTIIHYRTKGDVSQARKKDGNKGSALRGEVGIDPFRQIMAQVEERIRGEEEKARRKTTERENQLRI